jgi:hypothetical protein
VVRRRRAPSRGGCGLGLLAAALAWIPEELCAGAWTLAENEAQVIATSTFTSGDRLFDHKGRLVPVAEYRKFELSAYGQYGLIDWATVLVAPSLQRVSVAPPYGGDYLGPGYSDFGVRLRLARSDTTVLSIQTTASVAGASNDRNPAEIGNTDPEADFRMLVGKSLYVGAWPAFLDLQAAYRVRAGPPPDEYRLDITFGVRPAAEWLVMAQSFNVVSTGRGAGIFRDTRYHKVQGSVVWEFSPGWAVQVGALTTVAGRNALRERGLVAGLWRWF